MSSKCWRAGLRLLIGGLITGLALAAHAQSRASGPDTWQYLPAEFAGGITAATGLDPDWVMFVSGTEAVFYTLIEEHPERGVVARDLRETAGWPAEWSDGVTAAFQADADSVVLLHGRDFVVFDLDTDGITTRPEPLGVELPDAWEQQIDAVAVWGPGQALIFRGGEYLEWNVEQGEVVGPYRLADWPGWPADWADGVDAALNPGFGTVFFFRRGEMLRFVGDATASGFAHPTPEPISTRTE